MSRLSRETSRLWWLGSRCWTITKAIPLSAFYPGGFEQRIVRFCFAKKDETLDLAIERLRSL